jgi:glycosyltransferase involved in cell wall biosynthesis
VGGPRKSCGWFRDELREDVRKLGLAERIQFTGVRLDLADIMNALDIFICVSENQEFNCVLVEAMYFGKPVVATGIWGGSVVAETGVRGIPVPPRNPTGMPAHRCHLLAGMFGRPFHTG